MSTLRIGQRVADREGFIGTVRYIGPVATSKSAETQYAGIEWDDADRGKNDGSVTTPDGEVRYFTCRMGQGSFLKLRLIDTGAEIVDALNDKYNDTERGGGGVVQGEHGEDIEIQFVGVDQIRAKQALHRLQNVSLRGARVSHVAEGRLTSTAPHVRELDLRENLLSDWRDVARLGKQLPSLRVLNLAGNRMMPLSHDDIVSLEEAFPRLEVLVLSGTGVEWPSVVRWAAYIPHLLELHVCENGVTSLRPALEGDEKDTERLAEAFPKLQVLSLNDNAVPSWEEAWRLRSLPNLQRLWLNQNQLAHVSYAPSLEAQPALMVENPAVAPRQWSRFVAHKLAFAQGLVAEAPPPMPGTGNEAAGSSASAGGSSSERELDGTVRQRQDADIPLPEGIPFASLEALALNGNPIHAWPDVEGLNAFPSVSWLRLQSTPLTDTDLGPSRARQECIARLGRIRVLNGSDVRQREREDAEKSYARRLVQRIKEDAGVNDIRDWAQGDPLEVAQSIVASNGAVLEADDDEDSSRSWRPLARAIHAEHPRFFPLLVRFGELVSQGTAGATTRLADSVVDVTIRSMAGRSCMMEPLRRKLPLSMSIVALKQLAARAFKMEVPLQRASFRDASNAYPTMLDDDMKTLGFYAVSDGGEILIEEIDEKEAERQEEEKREAMERRMQSQADEADAFQEIREAEVEADRAAALAAHKP